MSLYHLHVWQLFADLMWLLSAQVHNSCFFKGAAKTDATWLIANPPYIPAADSDILMPALHGGEDGANLTRVRCI